MLLNIFAYARFVEPRILLTKHHQIKLDSCYPDQGAIKLAVFSDTHNGLFANAMPVDRIVKAVNATNPDAVLIAGDFTYFLHPQNYKKIFSPLSHIAAPIYGVLGNHDVGIPGPDMSIPLSEFLPTRGVIISDNRIHPLPKNYELIGLSDSWEGNQDFSLLSKPKRQPRIVLTHNPKTILFLEKDSFDLLISGHTHGGQIYLPGLTCKLVEFACHINRYGYKKLSEGVLFVTSGTGMVGLPMRFNTPPRIDILSITHDACS